jgi:hypothetical protein
MQLENILRRIHTNADNLAHGRLPCLRFATTSFWHTDAVGGRPHHQSRTPVVIKGIYLTAKMRRHGGWVPAFAGTTRYAPSFSRHDAPEVCKFAPPQKERGRTRPSKEGAGKTGCALHPRSRVHVAHQENAHEHTGSAEAVRPSLRNGFTAYFVLSPVTGFLATVIPKKGLLPRNLTPASGRQDHTTSPYANHAVRLRAQLTSIAPRAQRP